MRQSPGSIRGGLRLRACALLVGLVLLGCANARADQGQADPSPSLAEPAVPPSTAPSLDEADEPDEPGDAPAPRPTRQFSDGPRNVPAPSGRAMRIAANLGLGRRETGSHLLTHAPDARWVRAARARRPRNLLWPVRGGRFGRGHGFTRRERRELRHEGVDIGASTGTPVRAAAEGIVAYSDNGLHGYGNCVIVVHGNGWISLYAHLKKAVVQAGQHVRRGALLGQVGATGIARGPHLHFELRERGASLDPLMLFAGAPDEVARMQRASRPRRRTRSRAR